MAQYYYNKYQVRINYGNEPGTMWEDSSSYYSMAFSNAYKNISWNGSSWVGGTRWGSGENVYAGNVAYTIDGGGVYKWVANHGNQAQYSVDVKRYYTNPQGTPPNTSYTQGALVQSNIVADNGIYPTNGRHSDGFWYVRGAALPTNTAPTTPGAFTSPTPGMVLKGGQSVTLSWGKSGDADGNLSNYEVEESLNGGAFASIPSPVINSVARTITSTKSITSVAWRVRAKDSAGAYSAYQTSPTYTINHNATPIATLVTPSNNQTLYENDVYIIDGTVIDTNTGDTVTVRYQIGAGTERAIKAYLSTGALETFGKQLTFKGSNLYDGETLIAENLVDGVPHTLKIWATDDNGGTSTIVERTFYVVPNRAPGLTVTPPTIEGLINSDTFDVEGEYEDLDGNNTVVSYRLNGASSVKITEGTGGAFSFTLTFGDLKDGSNTIVIEAIDSYNAKTSKTVRLQKTRIETPILRSVQRYKLKPASGSASELLFWVRKLTALDVAVSISFGMTGEVENFVPITASESVDIDGTNMTEQEFYIQVEDAKDHIIIQFDTTRADENAPTFIESIKGVVK